MIKYSLCPNPLSSIHSRLSIYKVGVSHGSIVGPFLFSVYVNDLVYELRHCDANATLYADDAILYCTDSVLIFINYQAY